MEIELRKTVRKVIPYAPHVLLALLLSLSFHVWARYGFSNSCHQTCYATVYSQLIIALGAIVALIGYFENKKREREEAKRSRKNTTLAHLYDFMDRERKELDILIEHDYTESSVDFDSAYLQEKGIDYNVHRLLDIYEYLSTGITHDVFDQEIIMDVMGHKMKFAIQRLYGYILKLQNTEGDDVVYKELLDLSKKEGWIN